MTTATATDDPFSQPPDTRSADPDNGAYSADGKTDRWGRYRLPHPESGRVMPWTRATTLAKSISDTYKLSQWSQRMTAAGIVLRPDLAMLVAGFDVREDRDAFNDVCERAKDAAGAKIGANLGTALHTFTEQYDRGEKPRVPPSHTAHLQAYAAALTTYGLTVEPSMIERTVPCLHASTAGTFDRIFRLRTPCPKCQRTRAIGDLKTGRDLEYGWNEIAIQLGIYAHGDAVWDKVRKVYEPMPEVCLCTAVVIHLPANLPGQPATATVYDVDIAAGWAGVELCLAVRAWRKRKGLAVPRVVADVPPVDPANPLSAPAAVHSPVWAERISVAVTAADLAAIFTAANARGEWTPELLQLGLDRNELLHADTAGG